MHAAYFWQYIFQCIYKRSTILTQQEKGLQWQENNHIMWFLYLGLSCTQKKNQIEAQHPSIIWTVFSGQRAGICLSWLRAGVGVHPELVTSQIEGHATAEQQAIIKCEISFFSTKFQSLKILILLRSYMCPACDSKPAQNDQAMSAI